MDPNYSSSEGERRRQEAALNRIPQPILDLAKDDPDVNAAVKAHLYGHLLYEPMLEELVVHLSRQKLAMRDTLIKAKRLEPVVINLAEAHAARDVKQFKHEYQNDPPVGPPQDGEQ